MHVRFWHMDEVNMPGTLANTKVKFHHRKAGKEVKVCFAPDTDEPRTELSYRIIMPVWISSSRTST